MSIEKGVTIIYCLMVLGGVVIHQSFLWPNHLANKAPLVLHILLWFKPLNRTNQKRQSVLLISKEEEANSEQQKVSSSTRHASKY